LEVTINIFYLDHNVDTCAEYHVDKHVVKMILEYAQLLSTAHRVLDGVKVEKTFRLNDSFMDSFIYKATHVNHPSAIWARHSRSNYMYLYDLWLSLMREYTFRYGKVHKSSRLIEALKNPPKNISNGDFTQPTPAMPDDCKVPGDSIASYRKYYVASKSKLASWKMRTQPEWFELNLGCSL